MGVVYAKVTAVVALVLLILGAIEADVAWRFGETYPVLPGDVLPHPGNPDAWSLNGVKISHASQNTLTSASSQSNRAWPFFKSTYECCAPSVTAYHP